MQVKERYGPNLDRLQSGHVIGILVDGDNCLHLYVNGVDQGKKILIFFAMKQKNNSFK